MTEKPIPERLSIMETRFDNLQDAIKMIADSQKRIADSHGEISRSLSTIASLEQSHAETRGNLSRLYEKDEEKDKRLREIETKMPILIETRGWILAAVATVIMAAVLGAGSSILKTWWREPIIASSQNVYDQVPPRVLREGN